MNGGSNMLIFLIPSLLCLILSGILCLVDKPWWFVFLICGILFFQYPMSRYFELKFNKFKERE